MLGHSFVSFCFFFLASLAGKAQWPWAPWKCYSARRVTSWEGSPVSEAQPGKLAHGGGGGPSQSSLSRHLG